MDQPTPFATLENIETNHRQQALYKKTLSRLGFGVCAFILLTYAFQIGFQLLISRFAPQLLHHPLTLQLLSFFPMYGAGFPVFYWIISPLPVLPKPPAQKMKPTHFALLLIAAFGTMYLCNFLSMILVTLLSALKGAPLLNPLLDMADSPQEIFYLMIFGAILAPIMEEYLFRGLLMERLRQYGDLVCILTSALLFSLLHGNFSQLFYAFGLGVLLACIALRYHTIWYGVLIHAAVNLVGGVISPLLALQEDPLWMFLMVAFLFLTIGATILIGALAFPRFRGLRPNRGVTSLTAMQKRKLFCQNAGMLAFLCLSAGLIAYSVIR